MYVEAIKLCSLTVFSITLHFSSDVQIKWYEVRSPSWIEYDFIWELKFVDENSQLSNIGCDAVKYKYGLMQTAE